MNENSLIKEKCACLLDIVRDLVLKMDKIIEYRIIE